MYKILVIFIYFFVHKYELISSGSWRLMIQVVVQFSSGKLLLGQVIDVSIATGVVIIWVKCNIAYFALVW